MRGVVAGAAVVVPRHHGARVAGPVQRQHGVGRRRSVVMMYVAAVGTVEVVRVDLAADGRGRPPLAAAADVELEQAGGVVRGTGCA